MSTNSVLSVLYFAYLLVRNQTVFVFGPPPPTPSSEVLNLLKEDILLHQIVILNIWFILVYKQYQWGLGAEVWGGGLSCIFTGTLHSNAHSVSTRSTSLVLLIFQFIISTLWNNFFHFLYNTTILVSWLYWTLVYHYEDALSDQ